MAAMEITVLSGVELKIPCSRKNPYVIVYIDPENKCRTSVKVGKTPYSNVSFLFPILSLDFEVYLELFTSTLNGDVFVGKGSFEVNQNIVKTLKSGSPPIFSEIVMISNSGKNMWNIQVNVGRYHEDVYQDDFKGAGTSKNKTFRCGSCETRVSSSNVSNHRCKGKGKGKGKA